MLQAFVSHLMAKLRELGIGTPDPGRVPPIIYHDGNVNFPGETLQQAVKEGGNFFRSTPKIIFVLLPDNCAPLSCPCLPYLGAAIWPC